MLRRWPHALRPAPLHAPQRAFWSQAKEILSRLTSINVDPVSVKRTDDNVPHPGKQNSASQWRLQVETGVEFPQSLETASSNQKSEAKKLFSDLVRHLRNSSDTAQLLQSWELVKQCQPIVVRKNGVRLLDETRGENEALSVLQMLPADVFAQRVAGSNRRTLFVGSTRAGGNVVAANEAVVVALLVEYFYALKDHKSTIGLFESYCQDRLNLLKNRSLPNTTTESSSVDNDALRSSSDTEKDKKYLELVRITRLWLPARSAYLKALATNNKYHEVAEFVREDMRNLHTACESVMTMLPVLIGCRKQSDSSLARLAIDTMSTKNPASVLPLRCYELAFKAAIQKANRDDVDVDNALWIAHKMRDDAGYIIRPKFWFALFNTSLHQKREDCALEIFNMYSNNFTSLNQDHFRRALRKACDLNHPDVVLAMVRQWLGTVDDNNVDTDSKTKVLNYVLSRMIVNNYSKSTITEIIEIMGSSRFEISSGVLQRAVKLILDDASKSHSPPEVIKNSLDFWTTHSPAVVNSVLLMYALLHQCLERDWLDECELVVKELAERGLAAVPCNTIVKVLEANEGRERFEDNVIMCQVIVKSLGRQGLKSLNQQFFERYLKALLHVGHFDKVIKQHTKLTLGKRFPDSSFIASALRDAKF